MKKLLACLLLATALLSCKGKKKKTTNDGPFFNVKSVLLGQLKELDTAHVRFTRIETANGHSDTTALPADQVRAAARDFTDLPDITSDNYKDLYEETNTYEESLNNEILVYTSNDDKAPVRIETVLLEPDESNNMHPATILANRTFRQGDAMVTKDLAWHIGKRFQVVTKTVRLEQPEEVKTVIVAWE